MNSAAARTEIQRAIAVLVFITALWGISFPLLKMTNLLMERNQHEAMGISAAEAGRFQWNLDLSAAALMVTLRFALAFVVLMVCFPRQYSGLTAQHWLLGAVVGFVLGVGILTQIFALYDIPASRSGFLTSLTVVFTPLIMVTVTRRRPPLNVILAVGVALFGVAILTGAMLFDAGCLMRLSENFTEKIGLGDLLTILAAAIFALEIVLIDVFSRRMPPALLTPGMFAAIVLTGATLFAVLQFGWAEAAPLASWAELFATPAFPLLTLAMCLLCTLVPFYYMNKYQSKVTPTQAALIYSLEPVFVVLWAIILPDLLSPTVGVHYESEAMTWALAGGGGLVIAANVLGLWQRDEG